MLYLMALILPVVSFLLQSYPRFFNKYFGVDVWTRFLEIDLVRKNNHHIPKTITKGFIIQGDFDYPPLFPWLLSFVPKKTLEKLQGFVAPFFDAVHCLIIFLIAYQITNRTDIALLAQLIYMSIPIIALENSYLTARSFGYLSLTLALYPLLLCTASPNIYYLLFAYIFAVVIFLTHRFATQSFLFAVIFFSFFDNTFFYLIIFISGFLTAVLITKGYYLKVLKGHWFNIYFWIINTPYRWVHQVTQKSQAEGKRDFVGKIYILLGKFSPLTLLTLNSWILCTFLFIFLKTQHAPLTVLENPLLIKFTAWIFFFYLLAILVLSVRRLLPIGEGQRYLEMATAPCAILASILFFTFFNSPYKNIALETLIALLVANFSVIFFVQIKLVIRDQTRSLTDNMHKAFKYIDILKNKPRIICIPHQMTTMTLYNSKAQVLVNADNKGLIYGDVMDFYPIVKKPMTELAKKFKLDYLLLRESYASLRELKLKKKHVVFRSGDIVLVRL